MHNCQNLLVLSNTVFKFEVCCCWMLVIFYVIIVFIAFWGGHWASQYSKILNVLLSKHSAIHITQVHILCVYVCPQSVEKYATFAEAVVCDL